MTLKKKSQQVSSIDPSEEFPFTWIDMLKPEIGMFYRTAEEARNDAETNNHGFQISSHVIIVKVIDEVKTK
jgi:hypothetical protein